MAQDDDDERDWIISRFLFLVVLILVVVLVLNYSSNVFGISGRVVQNISCSEVDLDFDGDVDSKDLEIFSSYYGKTSCSVSNWWCDGTDINRDGKVDLIDFDIFSANYGTRNCSVTAPVVLCESDFVYGDWAECKVNYEFDDLLNRVEELEGRQSRFYEDRNGCVASGVEERVCSVELEVFAERVEWCGSDYYEIYEKATGKLLSRIKDNKQESIPSLDILFNQGVEDFGCEEISDSNIGTHPPTQDSESEISEIARPQSDSFDYFGVVKIGLLVLFIGFVILYFFISKGVKKEEEFMPIVRQKVGEVGEREEFFG